MSKILEIPSVFSRTHYRIVFEKQASSQEKNALSFEEQKLFEELYIQVQENPVTSLKSLIQFYEQQPQVPEIANLLAYAYLRVKKRKEAEVLIEKTYLDHPEYLIARVNFADQCLRLKKLQRIPEIFKGCFELQALYPQQKIFHYAEFRGFQVVLGFYHLEIGQRDKAEEHYQLAFQVDPLHPSVAALEKKLLKTSLLKKCLQTLQKLAGISQKD